MSFSLTANFLQNSRGVAFTDGGGLTWSFNKNTNQITANGSGAGAAGANPTAKVGLTTVNGTASTFMRSDGAPPIDQTITPTWSGLHTFGAGITISAGAFTLNGHTLTLAANATVSGTNTGDQTLPTGANPSASIGLTAVNGSSASFMRADGAPALSVAITPTWSGLHTFTSASIKDSAGNGPYPMGYLGAPFNAQSSGYTLVLADRGKVVHSTSGAAITIPSGVFSAGDKLHIACDPSNSTSGTTSIVQGSGLSLFWAGGAAATGNRTVTGFQVVDVFFSSATAAYIRGTGIS